MLLLALGRAGRQLPQQVPGLPLLLRSFASNSTKEAVERTLVVDTLAQVRCRRCGVWACPAGAVPGPGKTHSSPPPLYITHWLPSSQANKFESLGFTRQQAEDMTQHLTEQIILDRMRLSDKFSAKVELEKVSFRVKRGFASSCDRQHACCMTCMHAFNMHGFLSVAPLGQHAVCASSHAYSAC